MLKKIAVEATEDAVEEVAEDAVSADSADAASADAVTEEEVEAAPAPVEESGLQVLKQKFIEGGAGFMALPLICLILGLAYSHRENHFFILDECKYRQICSTNR